MDFLLWAGGLTLQGFRDKTFYLTDDLYKRTKCLEHRLRFSIEGRFS